MKVNLLLFSACVGLATTAFAAFTSCVTTKTPCDSDGNYYSCTKLGWTGPNPVTYCAANDQSTGPGKTIHPRTVNPITIPISAKALIATDPKPVSIDCTYGNQNFIVGPDNGSPTRTYVYDTPRAYRNSAIQFCERPANQGRYVIIAEMGSVHGNGVIDTILNPPQEVLMSSVLPSGETKLEINTARLDQQKPEAQSFLILSADGTKVKLFDVKPNVNHGQPMQSGSFHSSNEFENSTDVEADSCFALCGRRCQDSPVFCGMW